MLRTARAPLAAFLLLCLLGSLGPLRREFVAEFAASAMPLWLGASLPYALAAMACTAYALSRRVPWLPTQSTRVIILISLGIFVLPALSLRFLQAWLDPFTEVALWALAPVFTVVLEPHLAPPSQPPRHALVAALASAAGLLLVFPFQLPRSTAAFLAWLALLLTVLVVAATYCRAVHLASRLARPSVAPLAAIACAVAAATFLVVDGFARMLHLSDAVPPTGILWASLVNVPGLLLLFWLLPRLSAARIATRFVLSPLFSSITGLILLRPSIGTRDALGLVLAAFGSAWLLLAPKASPDSSVSQLPLGSA